MDVRARILNLSALFVLISGAVSAQTVLIEDFETPDTAPGDGVLLHVTKSRSLPGSVGLQWQGGAPNYAVHKATSPTGVHDAASQVLTTLDQQWSDFSLATSGVTYYLVRGRGTCWQATADAFVTQDDPTGNYGGEDYLEASDPQPRRMSYLNFALDGALPKGAEILNATFVIEQIGGNAGSTIQLRQVIEGWSENRVSYNTRPVASSGYGTTYNASNRGRRQWNLTELVQQWSNGTSAKLGIELSGYSEADYAIFSSRDDVAPLLCVDWFSPFEQASNLLRNDSAITPKVESDRGVAISVNAEVAAPAADPVDAALWYLNRYRNFYGLTDAEAETFLDRRVTDDEGRTTLTFGTRHENIRDRIEQITVEVGDSGLFRVPTIYGATARLLPAVQKVRLPANPVVTPQQARMIAEETVTTGAVERLGEPSLEWFDPNLDVDQGEQVRPTWRVALAAQDTPADGWSHWVVNVDAETGNVLRTFLLDMTVGDRPGEKFKIRTANDSYKKSCWDATTVDDPWFDESGALPQYPGAGGDDYGDGLELINGVHGIYHLYYDSFSRQSWDAKGKKIRGMVDAVNPKGGGVWRNAHYSPACNMMVFGDGLAVDDVVGHEFTHGVIRWTAELEYINDSGALNESLADYFGSRAAGDWVMAEDIYMPGGPPTDIDPGPLRDMSDPPLYGQPDHVDPGQSGDLRGKRKAVSANGANDSNDNGGVHINDADGDGVPNSRDNCLGEKNADQADLDGDGSGDKCDPDDVNDGDRDWVDNCIRHPNPGQEDANADGIGDACADLDNDGLPIESDNCPTVANPGQENLDRDSLGDVCDTDDDDDGYPDRSDNCPRFYNNQADIDSDGHGDDCDNCPALSNSNQTDTDNDTQGDACDTDDDNDTLDDMNDNCPTYFNPRQIDNDGNGMGMWCDVGELSLLQGFAEQVELDIFLQDNDPLEPVRFEIFPCKPGATCPDVLPEVFEVQVEVVVLPAYHVRIVDDRGWEMDSAEFDAAGNYVLNFVADHEYSYDAGGVTQVYAGRRYFVEMLAAEGAAPQQVTGRINVTATVGSP